MIYREIQLKELYPQLQGGQDPRLEMILLEDYLPSTGAVRTTPFKRPAVLICPGGAYRFTWGGEGWPTAFGFLEDGCNCFVLHYSTTPCSYPQQILEVACALDYIHTHAEEFLCDCDKLAIMGFSAGGHVAASYCTLRTQLKVQQIMPQTVPIQAAMLCYPVITAEAPWLHQGSISVVSGHSTLTEEDIALFSLEKHVDSAITPPTFLWAAADDKGVNPVNSFRYCEALATAGIPYELHVFPKGGHGSGTGKLGTTGDHKNPNLKYRSVWMDLARRWLREQFDL